MWLLAIFGGRNIFVFLTRGRGEGLSSTLHHSLLVNVLPNLGEIGLTAHSRLATWRRAAHHRVLPAGHHHTTLGHASVGLAIGLTVIFVLIRVTARARRVIRAHLLSGLADADHSFVLLHGRSGLLLGLRLLVRLLLLHLLLLQRVVLLHLHLLVLRVLLHLRLLDLLLHLRLRLLLVHDGLLGGLLGLLGRQDALRVHLVNLLHLLELLMLLHLLQLRMTLHHVERLGLLGDLLLLRRVPHLLLLLVVLLRAGLVGLEVIKALGGYLIAYIRIGQCLLKQIRVVHMLVGKLNGSLLLWRRLLLHLRRLLLLALRVNPVLALCSAWLLHLLWAIRRLLVAHRLLLLARVLILASHLLRLTSHDLLVSLLWRLLHLLLLMLHVKRLVHGCLLLSGHLVLRGLIRLLLGYGAILALRSILRRRSLLLL